MGNDLCCCNCFKGNYKSAFLRNLDDPNSWSKTKGETGNVSTNCSGNGYDQSYYTFYDDKNYPGKLSKFTISDNNLTNSRISRDHFEEIKLLGRGSFGKVLLVKKKQNNKLYAMKILKKALVKMKNQEAHTKTERRILEKIDHPFIVSLQFAFQDENKLFLVTQFMQGGELFYHLRREKVFKEERVKFYAAEIVLALEYLHSNNCIYRDLKPENILLDKDGHLRITDFGLSKMILSNKEERAFTICGTAEYLAPEILLEKGHDKSVDWWSLGALLYEMLSGYSPFKKPAKDNVLDIETYTKPVYMHPFFSEEAKSFIQGLLTVNPKKRLGSGPNGTKNVKSHPFFKGINFSALMEKAIKPPFVPLVADEEDLSYFDKMFTDENIFDPTSEKTGILSPKMENGNYDGFTYVKQTPVIEKESENDIQNI